MLPGIKLRTSVLLLFLCWFTAGVVQGLEELNNRNPSGSDDTSHWVDPQEKFSLSNRRKPGTQQPSGTAVGKQRSISDAECEEFCSSAPKNRNELIMLRHVLRNFVTVVRSSGNNEDKFDVIMQLRKTQLMAFEQLLDSPDIAHTAPIIDSWNEMLRTLEVHRQPTSIEMIERKIGLSLTLILQVLLILTFPILLIYVQVKMEKPLIWMMMRIFQNFLLFAFIVSFPWNWFRMYQEKVAEQLKHLGSADCEPLSLGQTIVGWFDRRLSISPEASSCEKYLRAIHVNPLLDVPPSMALIVTITSFFVEPAKYVGKAIGEFFQAVLAPLPFYLWPVIFVFIILVTFLLIIVRANYKVHLPWLFARIEPSHPPAIYRNLDKAIDRNSESRRDPVHSGPSIDNSRRRRSSLSPDVNVARSSANSRQSRNRDQVRLDSGRWSEQSSPPNLIGAGDS